MNKYSVKQVRELLEKNNQDQPKAKYSNNVILSMLPSVNANTIFEVEPTRKGFELNRGTVVEEIVKAVLGVAVNKTYSNKSDVDLQGVNKAMFEIPNQAKRIEIKFATTFAPASQAMPKTKWVILITNEGAFLVETSKNKGRFTNYSSLNGTRLNKLSAMLNL